MPIMEENPKLYPNLGNASHLLNHEENIDHALSNALYSLGTRARRHDPQPIDGDGE
jgi:hypothetical protein